MGKKRKKAVFTPKKVKYMKQHRSTETAEIKNQSTRSTETPERKKERLQKDTIRHCGARKLCFVSEKKMIVEQYMGLTADNDPPEVSGSGEKQEETNNTHSPSDITNMQLNVTNNDPRDNTDAVNDMINDSDIDFLMEIEEDVAGQLDNRTNEGNPSIYYIGLMSLLCPYCSALRFPNELLSCCHKGKVTLALDVHPEDLRSLFQKKQFLDKIRSYNNVFAFTWGSDGSPSRIWSILFQDSWSNIP